MESTEQKSIQSKSLNSNRISIRRKSSFNKVRLHFENKCKSTEKNSSKKSLKTVKELNSDLDLNLKKCESTTVSKTIRKISNSVQNIPLNDEKRCETTSNTSHSVKNQIVFFENKSNYDKTDGNKFNSDELTKQIKLIDNNVLNYRNVDKTQNYDLKSDCNSCEKPLNVIQTEFNIRDNELNLISNDNSEQAVIESLESKSKVIRSLSLCSDTSIISDFVSFDKESEVVFRKPHHNASDDLIVKPVPKQRTSLLKNITKSENPTEILKTDSFKERLNVESNKRESKRLSGLSQDSGISESSLNTSFLWLNSSHKNQQNQLNSNEDKTFNDYNKQNDQIYEHIYEELSNCRTLSHNDWVDIEFEGRQRSKTEEMPTRRPQYLRLNESIRKSFRPKLHKRKTNRKTNSVLKITNNDSESATEYEDIDDDEDSFDHTFETSKARQNQYFDKPEVEQNLCHIYEIMSDKEDSNHSNDIIMKNKSIARFSDKINVKRNESLPNIYTTTPQRYNDLINELNSVQINSKRGSTSSRLSSIYVNPNESSNYFHMNPKYDNYSKTLNSGHFHRNRAEILEKQISMTSSIASYLELNTYPTDDFSPFKSEPLYQFYQKDVRRRAELWIHYNQDETDLDYDDYENDTIYGKGFQSTDSKSERKSISPSDLEGDQIKSLCHRNLSAIDLVGLGPTRSLWCQLPQVINSGGNLLSTLSDKEKRLQESMFEIITSEASYCKSLNVLVSHFYNCIEFSENNSQVLSSREKNCLFSNITDIRKISSSLLTELEKRFEQNILLYDVCDILYDYAVNHFQCYIHYCAYQRDQEKLFTQLMQTRNAFVEIVRRLESNQICQNQTLLSFLMLPLQVRADT